MEISTGITRCLDHALVCILGAETLQSKQFYGQAALLAIIALEELGKIQELERMAAFAHNCQALWSLCWHGFGRRHEVKAANVWHRIAFDACSSGESLRANAEAYEEIGKRLMAIRSSCLYVDFAIESRNWTSPTDISDSKAAQIIRFARNILEEKTFFQKVGAYSEEFLNKKKQIYAACAEHFADLKDEDLRNLSEKEELELYEEIRPVLIDAYRLELTALLQLLSESGNLSERERNAMASLLQRMFQ